MDRHCTPIKLLILLAILLAFTSSSGCLRSFEEESSYNIRDMDIAAEKVGSAVVDLNITTYVEKYQGGPKEVSLLLKAFSTETGLLELQTEKNLGVIEPRKTKIVSQTLRLPKTGGYEISAVLFENNTQKASGKITVYNLEDLPADIQDIGIEISEMDFIVRQVTGGKVLLESDIYLTNEGEETSSDYPLLVKVREMNAGLLADKVWIQTGRIKPQTTVIRSVNLTVPDQYNYVLEALVWNNDTIVKRGEGYIKLSPVKFKDEKKTSIRKINTSEFESSIESTTGPREETAEMKTPGFGGLFAAASVFLALAIRRRAK